jgi:hypothetical protein
MKHKYSVSLDAAQKQLVISEYAELDKEIFSLLCEERYSQEGLRTALAGGTDALIAAFRTRNFYPTYTFAVRIAAAITTLLTQDSADPVEIVLDDADFLSRQVAEPPERVDSEEESDDIDDLLDDNVDEEFDDIDIDKINSGIKIADDDAADIEEEV